MAPGQVSTKSPLKTKGALKETWYRCEVIFWHFFSSFLNSHTLKTKCFSFTYLIEIKLINFVISRIFSCRNDGRVSKNWCRWRYGRAINLRLIKEKKHVSRAVLECGGVGGRGLENVYGNSREWVKFIEHLESSYIPSFALSDDMWYSDCLAEPSGLGLSSSMMDMTLLLC